MFNAYFVFHCLNMFCVEKQVSEFFVTQLATRYCETPIASSSRSFGDSLATRLRLVKIFAIEPHDSPSREMPRISFLKSFFVGNLF